MRRFRRAPGPIKVATALIVLASVWLVTNGIYQVIRKPSELFFPVSGTLFKTPVETWHSYAPIFRKHSTHAISPELLAALAQVEGSGNPIARTYWRWSWKLKPFEIYRPATSAVGMYQMTDGTFAEARHYCVHDHEVATEGAWDDVHSCWLKQLYIRVIPSHAVELTSAYLDVHVGSTWRCNRLQGDAAAEAAPGGSSPLCGAGAGDSTPAMVSISRTGSAVATADPRVYIGRVDTMMSVFAHLAAEEDWLSQ